MEIRFDSLLWFSRASMQTTFGKHLLPFWLFFSWSFSNSYFAVAFPFSTGRAVVSNSNVWIHHTNHGLNQRNKHSSPVLCIIFSSDPAVDFSIFALSMKSNVWENLMSNDPDKSEFRFFVKLSARSWMIQISGGSRIQVTGGHKTKAAGGVGGAVSPPAGFGAAPRTFLKFKCFQTVKSPISTPSAGDKNVLQAIVRLQNEPCYTCTLILKTIGNRIGDCAWSCSRGQTQPEKICKSQRTNQCHSLRTFYWFVLCNLQIFSGCVCPLEQLHAQSPFLFPIVFSINLIPFFDISSVLAVPSPRLFGYVLLYFTWATARSQELLFVVLACHALRALDSRCRLRTRRRVCICIGSTRCRGNHMHDHSRFQRDIDDVTGVSLSLLLTKVTHAQYRKRFRASYNNIWRYSIVRRGSRSRSRSREVMYDWDMYDHEIFMIEICMIEICD